MSFTLFKCGRKEEGGRRQSGGPVYANVSPLHKPHCTTEKGERRGCAVGGRPFKDPHYLNVAKNPLPPFVRPSLASCMAEALFAYSRARRPLMSERGMNKCTLSEEGNGRSFDPQLGPSTLFKGCSSSIGAFLPSVYPMSTG